MKQLIPAIVLVGVAVLPAYAHHSTVMFAADKEIRLTGIVKGFRYSNPHSSIQILVARDGARPVEYNIQTVSPLVLERAGIGFNALQRGETVHVRARPLKNGGPSGWLIDVTKADGSVLSLPEPYTD